MSFVTNISGPRQNQTHILPNFSENIGGRGTFSTNILNKAGKKDMVNGNIISKYFDKTCGYGIKTDRMSFVTDISGPRQNQTHILPNFSENIRGRGTFSTNILNKAGKKDVVNGNIIIKFKN